MPDKTMPDEPMPDNTTPQERHVHARMQRARYRAWHRGTREADYMIGGYFDRYSSNWSESDLEWFERLLDEDDVDVLAWALQTQIVPSEHAGAQMTRMQKLDYVVIPC